MAPPRHPSTYSSGGKIGLIVPPTNTVNEPEWGRLMPAGLTFHTVRMPIHAHTADEEARNALVRDIAAKVAELTPAGVDVVAYACTAGSMLHPLEFLPEAVSKIAGLTRNGNAGCGHRMRQRSRLLLDAMSATAPCCPMRPCSLPTAPFC